MDDDAVVLRAACRTPGLHTFALARIVHGGHALCGRYATPFLPKNQPDDIGYILRRAYRFCSCRCIIICIIAHFCAYMQYIVKFYYKTFGRVNNIAYICDANRRRWVHISNNSHGHTNFPSTPFLINLTNLGEGQSVKTPLPHSFFGGLGQWGDGTMGQ